MIKVLHVVNWLKPGGIEIQLLRILEGYDRRRFHMDVCVIGDDVGELAPQVQSMGAEVMHCRKSPNLSGFSNRLKNLIKDKGYGVIHSHFETWGGAIAKAGAGAGIPVRVVQFHSMKPWPEDPNLGVVARLGRGMVSAWGKALLYRWATHFLAVSSVVRDARIKKNANKPVFLWTGGVDTSRFAPRNAVDNAENPSTSQNESFKAHEETNSARAGEMSYSSSEPTVIWVGSLLPAKRLDLGLHIMAEVLKIVPNAKYVITGDGPERRRLEGLAESLNLGSSVQFLGTRNDVSSLLRRSSVFLTCSEVEGLPTALLEAQACAVSVAANDIPPHREALTSEMHPYMFDNKAPNRAVAGLAELLTNSGLRSVLGSAGRAFVRDRFDAASQLKKLEDYYSTWVSEKSK
jgi:glycosyltransferase involved in cell wall biosynthesis